MEKNKCSRKALNGVGNRLLMCLWVGLGFTSADLLAGDEPQLASSSISFSYQDTWRHDVFLGGRLFAATVDRNGDLIAQFQMDHTFIVNKERFEQFRPAGEGPDDLAGCFGITKIGEDLGIIDHHGKIKIFHETDKGYRAKRSINPKLGSMHFFVEDLHFFEGHWYVGGVTYAKDGDVYVTKHIKVQNEVGDDQNSLLGLPHKSGRAAQFMESYLRFDDGKFYFMREHDMVIHVLSAKTHEVLGEQRLKPPGFYTPLPDDFFLTEDVRSPNLEQRYIQWRTSYSRVEQMAVHQGFLIVQVRTAQEGKPLYDLRFYDLTSFDFVDHILTDSLLVTTEGEKLYFLRHGMPGHDDDAGEFILDIYQLNQKPTQP